MRDGFCDKHKRIGTAIRRDRERKFGNSTRRGYGYRWEKYRKAYFARNPLCAECLRNDRTTVAEELDHIKPRSLRPDLFWEPSNHQGLCKSCHREKTKREARAAAALRNGGAAHQQEESTGIHQ